MSDGLASGSGLGVTLRDEGTPRSRAHHHIAADTGVSKDDLREVLASRDLFLLLVRRELQVRFRQTALGVVWVILQPLVPALIFALVLGVLAQLPSAGVPYLLFVMSGMVAFTFFSSVVTRASGSFLGEGQLLTKVYFPRIVLPVAIGSASVVGFVVGSAVLLVMALLMGTSPTVALVAVPVLAFLVLVFALAIGLAFAALGAYYRDFAHVVPFLLQVLLYASPILYSIELVPPEYRVIYALNPLVGLVGGLRWAFLGTPLPDVPYLLEGLVVMCAVVPAGLFVFNRLERNMSDVI